MRLLLMLDEAATRFRGQSLSVCVCVCGLLELRVTLKQKSGVILLLINLRTPGDVKPDPPHELIAASESREAT